MVTPPKPHTPESKEMFVGIEDFYIPAANRWICLYHLPDRKSYTLRWSNRELYNYGFTAESVLLVLAYLTNPENASEIKRMFYLEEEEDDEGRIS